MLQEKTNSESINQQQNEYQELVEQVLSVLKGKRASLCKRVLKDLITRVIDSKSLVQ